MGEVLKILKETKIGDTKILIEQNAPLTRQGARVIHLQNEKFRFEMPESEFLKLAAALAYARNNFDFMKGLMAK